MGSEAMLTARLITCASEDENALVPVKLPADVVLIKVLMDGYTAIWKGPIS